MNVRSPLALSLAATLAAGSVALLPQPAQAQSARFYCARDNNGTYTTYADSARGKIPVIRWKSRYFEGAGYTPASRCEEVSSRFQTFFGTGQLNYLTTGMMNRQRVVCVASANGGPCADLLFTLRPQDDAAQFVQQLNDIRSGAAGPINQQRPRVYIDMNQFLNEAPTEGGAPAPAAAPAAQPTAPSSGPSGSAW